MVVHSEGHLDESWVIQKASKRAVRWAWCSAVHWVHQTEQRRAVRWAWCSAVHWVHLRVAPKDMRTVERTVVTRAVRWVWCSAVHLVMPREQTKAGRWDDWMAEMKAVRLDGWRADWTDERKADRWVRQ